MKFAKLSYVLTIGAALSLTAVGCRKGLDKTTHIPKGANPTVGGDLAGDPRLGPSSTTGNSTTTPTDLTSTGLGKPPGEGLPASDIDPSGWPENREEFKDQTVYFDYDKHNVKPSEVDKLKEVAHRMKNFQGMALRIEGHCDERGTEEYNRSLGDKRAQAVREFLASEGFDPTMMPTITFGEDKPADPGHTDAAFTKNRRGELILLSSRPHSGSGERITDRVESRAPRNE